MPTKARIQKLKRVAKDRQAGLTVVLEDIYDPHNAQAIFRTCDAFGVQTVHLVFEHQKPFDPRKIGTQSSASANKWLNFVTHRSTTETLSSLNKKGYSQIATVLDKNAGSIYRTQLTQPKLALWLGNEHSGLSSTAIKNISHHLYIPMTGLVQSLNLSVTAAICLYEITRQRQNDSSTDYSLEPVDQKKLLKFFVTR